MDINYKLCPERYRESFRNYIEGHIPTGDCYKAILSNNLQQSLLRADDETEQDLHRIVIFRLCAIQG